MSEDKTVEARKVTIAELRGIVTDASELAKGTAIADGGGLANLARHEHKLFADAAGSGAAPYKTQIVFGDGKVTGRCSCMAARSRPYCKHAAALLVSWARTPEAFAVAAAPPVPEGGARKKASVKRGKVDAAELKRKGVDQASTLLVELWQTGVDALAADRAGQVKDLAPTLRELGLRRLSARTLGLADLLEAAARRDGSLSPEAYASLVSDMWLTVKKLEKHLDGEALADEHVEELIGKTWTKKDRKPIAGLDLVEYAYAQRTTADDFVLRESRLFDVASGDHFVEKQILPAMIAKRIPPLRSRAGTRLKDASGSVFPSFAPRRLDVEQGTEEPLSSATLQAAVARALPTVSAALTALSERRRDVFAPPVVPVLVGIDTITLGGAAAGGAARGRVLFVDDAGGALFLAGGRGTESALVAALASVSAVAVFGDVVLDGALPTLAPLAIVGRDQAGELRVLPLGSADEDPFTRAFEKARAAAEPKEPTTGPAKTAATLLAEVRSDLARGFQEGFAVASSQRFLAPLVARLAELKLDKQAEALRAIAPAGAASADPSLSLDALVRVYQVLGIALSRVASAVRLDRAALVALPSLPSVSVPRPAVALSPEAAVAAEARGEIHRFERAYHVGVHFAGVSAGDLLSDTHRFWGDGDAVPFVLAAAKKDPARALDGAASVLARGRSSGWQATPARLAKLTAIRVLGASGTPAARRVLDAIDPKTHDPALLAFAVRAAGGGGPLLPKERLDELTSMVTAGSAKDDRIEAIAGLVRSAAVEGIPVLRAALRGDRTMHVREAAAYGLAALGDVLALDTFVTWLDAEVPFFAKVGARAIGQLGDVRGAGALLRALGDGVSPGIVGDALALLGPWVLGPLLDLTEAKPEVGKRASVGTLVSTFPADHAAATIAAWLAAAEADPVKLAARARLAFDVTSKRPDVARGVAEWCRERGAFAGDDKEAKALRKKIDAVLAPPKPKGAKGAK